MTHLFFDAGPIISLVMSRLDWILPKLKEKLKGNFYITPAVKKELIDRPLEIKRFSFEALQVMKMIKDGILEVYNEVPHEKVEELKNLANSSFLIKNKNIDIIQAGEMEAVTSVIKTNGSAIVMDERTLRLFIENNKEMKSLLEVRFKKKVTSIDENRNKFSKQLKGIKIIRSIELVGVAYKLGFLDQYIPETTEGKKILLNAVLWTTKYNGCAVTTQEIEKIKNFLLK